MDQLTHTVRRSNWINIIRQCQDRPGTYKRKLQDLPILGRTTYLIVNAYEYQCDNSSCDVTTFVENVDGFLNYYSRMTERCEDFICTLALETSCEGSARICRSMNLKTSGDSIIRLLTKCQISTYFDVASFRYSGEYSVLILNFIPVY